MPKKKEKKIVDTGFVPGIYNYCDRWCERCPLQLRCMSYMMGKKLKERTKVNLGEEMPDDDESALARLKKNWKKSRREIPNESNGRMAL